MRAVKSLSAALCLAVAATLGAAPASAQAPGAVPVQAGAQVTAVTTADLNVRSGPGTNYGVLFVVPRGQTVTVQGCNQSITWCSVLYGGRAGWASATYLRSTQNQQPIPNAGQQLGIAIFNFVAGAIARELGIQPAPQPQPQPPAGPRAPGANEVCFYDGGSFDGESVCVTMGQSNTTLSANWNDRISSIRVGANAQVQVCGDVNYGGWCETYYDDVSLRNFRNNSISSYRTTGFGQNPAPQPQVPAAGSTACFFDGGGYGGAGFCLRQGGSLQSVPAEWNDRITSIRIDPGITVQVCRDAYYAGWCEEYTSSVPYLPASRDNAISSIRVL